MPDWHYTSGGQQHGPVSEDQLRALVAAGSIRPSDLVWNQSLPQWVPAGQAGMVMPAQGAAPNPGYAVAAAPASYGALGYEAPSADAIPFTDHSLQLLRQTRPWAMFIAIMFFIFGGLCVIAGVTVAAAASFVKGGGVGIPVWLGLIYVVLAVVYILPAIYMSRFCSRVGRLARLRQATDLEGALAAMKSTFRVSGILMIIFIVGYLVVIAGAIAFHLK